MTQLAITQIEQLASSDGPIQVRSIAELDGLTHITVSLDTRKIQHVTGGIRVRQREVFTLVIPAEYPFVHPSIVVPHKRWAGTAHVQWGSVICIYAAPSVEWNPSDGLRGMLERLTAWVERAALGTLDPEGQPLHPPVAYPTATAGSLVVRANLGALVPWHPTKQESTATLFAWCVKRDGERADVLEWLDFGQVADRVLGAEFNAIDADGRMQFVAAAALISEQIGFEYPKRGDLLIRALEAAGISSADLLAQLAHARLVNSYMETTAANGQSLPNVIILGTPSRRTNTDLLAHLSAWKLGDLGGKVADALRRAEHGDLKPNRDEIVKIAEEWIGASGTEWMRVYEDRQEVTRLRDEGTTAGDLRGKRVLLLGCGALGGPIAEHCVRAGVKSITLVDAGRVGPGILVRQPYDDDDISRHKAIVLAARLRAIGLTSEVFDVAGDAITTVLSAGAAVPEVDLIIDATADVGVRNALERRRMIDRSVWPDLLTVMIGHDASRGIVLMSRNGASGGPVDVLRRFALDAFSSPSLSDIAEDFFPREQRADLFFPEPGCSSPTFIGSHADVAGLAAVLLNTGLELLAGVDTMAAAGVRPRSRTLPPVAERRWSDDVILSDANHGGYEIRVSNEALAEMRAESRRGRRMRDPKIETGGMIFGAFDEACEFVNVDSVSGPPPDSLLSELFFDHGTAGTQQLVDEYRLESQSRQNFVGLWHTHPFGPASPSQTDDEGMWGLVNLDVIGKRALMMIVGGPAWEHWLIEGSTPSIYARISVLGRALPSSVRPRARGFVVARTYPGGYGYPRRFHEPIEGKSS